MTMPTSSNPPAYLQLLVHRETDNAICGTLVVHGWEEQDLPDGRQEVRCRAIERFAAGVPIPETLSAMKAFCATIARNYAVDALRKKKYRERYDVGLCETPEDYSPLEPSGEQRDPVDTARQLEEAAALFREGKMPDDGVDILEGVASGCSYPEIAGDLGISARALRGRLNTMRKVFRQRMEERGMIDEEEK